MQFLQPYSRQPGIESTYLHCCEQDSISILKVIISSQCDLLCILYLRRQVQIYISQYKQVVQLPRNIKQVPRLHILIFNSYAKHIHTYILIHSQFRIFIIETITHHHTSTVTSTYVHNKLSIYIIYMLCMYVCIYRQLTTNLLTVMF